MELRHIRYFVAVAEARNFTRAARRLGVSQPPLSRQIRELEAELGTALFERDTRPVRLTEGGRLLYEQAVPILGAVEQLRRAMHRFVAVERRRFVIGFVGSVIYGAMPEMVRRFRAAAPEVDIGLVEMTTLEQIAALKDGRIDAGIGRLRIDDPEIGREVLREEPLIAAVAADHPRLAGGGPVALADLAGEPLIVYPSLPRPSYADQVLRLFRDHGLRPATVREVREVQTALGLVAAQAGVAIVPESLRHFQRNDIAYVRLREEGAVSPIILSRRIGDNSPEARLVLEIGQQTYH